MSWFWRLLALFIFLVFLQTVITSQPRSFIAWQDRQNWSQIIQYDMKQLQRFSQDFPASIEVEIRHLWGDFQANGDGKKV